MHFVIAIEHIYPLVQEFSKEKEPKDEEAALIKGAAAVNGNRKRSKRG